MDAVATALKVAQSAKKILDVIRSLIDAGKDAKEVIDSARDLFSKDEITEVDLEALDARIDAERAKLHAPLPAPGPGETE